MEEKTGQELNNDDATPEEENNENADNVAQTVGHNMYILAYQVGGQRDSPFSSIRSICVFSYCPTNGKVFSGTYGGKKIHKHRSFFSIENLFTGIYFSFLSCSGIQGYSNSDQRHSQIQKQRLLILRLFDFDCISVLSFQLARHNRELEVLMKHRTLNDEALSYYHKHTAEIEIIRHDRSIEPSRKEILRRERTIIGWNSSSCLSCSSAV